MAVVGGAIAGPVRARTAALEGSGGRMPYGMALAASSVAGAYRVSDRK